MGHERVGLLPRTRKWRDIVGGISGFGEAGDVAGIVRQTTESIRDRLSDMEGDPSLAAAFKFLVTLSVCSRSTSPTNALHDQGIDVSADPSLLALAKAVQKWMPSSPPSLEYARMAEGAAMDAIAAWSGRAEGPEQNLFGLADQPFDVWRKASNGAGFCELSRIFFGKFTERYLNYFLEREASAIFAPDLSNPQSQQQVDNGRMRIDITFDNKAQQGFFATVRDAHQKRCPYVLFECKNYSDDIANPEFAQLVDRMNRLKIQVGFIVCRKVKDTQAILKQCQDRSGSGQDDSIVLVLDDHDVKHLLELRAKNDAQGVATYLERILRSILFRP